MSSKSVNENMPIGLIILRKGKNARRLIEGTIYDGESYSPHANLKLNEAVKLNNKDHNILASLLTKLNKIPNVNHTTR